jgi:hypothetical protein
MNRTQIDEVGRTYGLLNPEHGRINGNLALFLEFCFLFLSEFFEFTTDREK